MPLVDDALGGLTAQEADLREAELRLDATDDGVRLAIARLPEPEGLVTLSWRILPPAPSPAEAGSPAAIAASIRGAASAVGVDERLLGAIAAIESNFRPSVPSPTSSARGLFQFIDSTWNSLVKQFGSALGVAAGDRDDVHAQCMMGAKLLSLTIAGLQTKLGQRPTPGQCYAGHFLGVAGGAALAASNPNEAADTALGRFYATTKAGAPFAGRVIAANRAIFTEGGAIRTAGGVMGVLDRKMADGLVRASALFDSLPETAAAIPESGDPAWLGVARSELARGVAALPGPASNPRIEQYFTFTTFGTTLDGTAWCGAFASFCLGITNNLRGGKGSALASDWAGFGDALPQPRPGCVAVLHPMAPRSSGHVAFWLGTEGNRMRLLGGNQGERVSIESFPLQKLRAFRWPSA